MIKEVTKMKMIRIGSSLESYCYYKGKKKSFKEIVKLLIKEMIEKECREREEREEIPW